MARTDSERLEKLLATRDLIDDALFSSAGNGDVIEYTTSAGQTVKRSRTETVQLLDALNRQIANLKRSVNGPAINVARRAKR